MIENTNIDNEVFDLIETEHKRQIDSINLIASENYVSDSVIYALGSVLTNKYAEGSPGRRYYAGCKNIDSIEMLATQRLIDLFHAEAANVQPHSGSQANMAVYFSFLNPGDCILSMSLNNGGHLSHGSRVNFSGQIYNFVHYGVDNDGIIDYDNVEYLAHKYRPKLIVCGASSYSRIIDFERFKNIADSVQAYLLADIAHIAGMVATGLHPSPVPFADFVTGTTQKTLRGPRGGFILTKQEYSDIINRSVFPGIQGGPLMNVIAAKAICFREAAKPEFKNYITQVLTNASEMAERFRELGHKVVSGGTDNHLFILDLSRCEISGDKLQDMLEEVGINVSKQTIPNDKFGWPKTQGVRIGTAAVTTRGFGENECREVAEIISVLIKDFVKNKQFVKQRVKDLMANFRPYYFY